MWKGKKQRNGDKCVKNEKRRIRGYGNALLKSQETGLGRIHSDLWKGVCECWPEGSQSLKRSAESSTLFGLGTGVAGGSDIESTGGISYRPAGERKEDNEEKEQERKEREQERKMPR